MARTLLALSSRQRRARAPWLVAAFTLAAIGSAHAGDRTSPTASAWDLPPHRATVFLNFDGGLMTSGGNAAEDQAHCFPSGQADVKGWPSTAKQQAEIVELVRQGMAPFGVRIVDERPPRHLPYSQVMFVGIEGEGPSMSCTVDCADQFLRDTGYVMPLYAGTDPQKLANGALNVIGRNAGLDFTDAFDLYSTIYTTSEPLVWGTECTALSEIGSPSCISTHEKLCGEGTARQHDFDELTAVYGENSVDTVAPTVELLAPADGTMLEPGAPVTIEVAVSDDFEGFGWRLMLPGLGEEVPAYKGETSWTLTLPKGAHVIRVEAIDHDRNVGADEITVLVGVAAPDDTSTTDGSTTDDPTTGDPGTGEAPTGEAPTGEAPTGTTGADEDTDTAGSDDDTDDVGCTCRADAPTPGAAMWLALLTFGLVRRRR